MNKMYALILVALTSCGYSTKSENITKEVQQMEIKSEQNLDTITLGGGCYWCMEAVFQRMKGVEKVASGFSGGDVKNPAYKEVCNGTTGHAEVVKVIFDKNKTSLEDILAVFFVVHDPTTLNRQGADVGTQYRSAIYYQNQEQFRVIADAIEKLIKEKVFTEPIVTEVAEIKNFYIAQDDHQNYYNQNSNQSYCRFVVKEKVDKFEKLFKDKVK